MGVRILTQGDRNAARRSDGHILLGFAHGAHFLPRSVMALSSSGEILDLSECRIFLGEDGLGRGTFVILMDPENMLDVGDAVTYVLST